MGPKVVKIAIGVVLVLVAIVGVFLVNTMTAPRYYNVVIAAHEIPAYTPLQEAMDQGWIGSLQQSFPGSMQGYYVLQDELGALLQDGVIVERMRAGEPLMRVNVATGENAQKVRRLSVALTEPDYGIVRVPVEPAHVPKLYYGDLVDIYATFGAVRATELMTDVVVDPAAVLTETTEAEEAPTAAAETEALPVPVVPDLEESEAFTRTFSSEMPVTMRVISHALVVRINHKLIPNPQYGTGDQNNAPPYIEGDVESVDLLIPNASVEEAQWAILNGTMSIVLRPAVAGTVKEPPTEGFTWSDFNDLFWRRRHAVDVAWQEAGLEPPAKEP